jgi:hypothetical protein
MKRPVARRIDRKCAQGEVAVVVPRKGQASRVYGLKEYLAMREVPRRHKIWRHREKGAAAPDPLGAVKGTVAKPIRREEMYEE